MWFPALFVLLIFSAQPSKWFIDPKIKPHVEKVYELSDGNLDGRKFHINFGQPFFESNAAICYPWRYEIVVKKDKWDGLTETTRTLLIAHEVTHCMSKKWLHINGVDDFGCAEHYMNWSFRGSWCDRAHFKKYVKQMKEI